MGARTLVSGALLAIATASALGQVRPPGSAPSATPSSSISSDQIRARAAKMSEARALLNDPDPSVRMAALDEMTKSSDIALQEVAYEVGFSSADSSMRALALRRRLVTMSSLSLEITDIVNDPHRAANAQGDKYAKSVTWQLLYPDERSGMIYIGQRKLSEAEAKNVGSVITVSGMYVTIAGIQIPPYCQGSVHLDEGNALVGQMTCRGLVDGDPYDQVTVKVRGRVG